ncbi:hypothetical protein [Agrococcus jejuensis]|uniref:hypothetical protein n=1 Tax=Agrococcus jejuensis TaxID=399736 RepID=UPI0011A5E319|nr:hypothetical protein [Agrococcus jejuensis]
MRWEQVDERSSTWERDDARYRLTVYDGPHGTTTTTDVLDASIEQALEAARTLSRDDALLWSLALVSHDDRGAEGLVWLSGMDYHELPRTRQQWRRRAEMQDRLLRARTRTGQPPVLPDGRRVIRMFVDWGARWPLWETHGEPNMPTPSDLGLSAALGDALHAWSETWQDRPWDAALPDEAAWIAEGGRLHAALQQELVGIAEVRREFGP